MAIQVYIRSANQASLSVNSVPYYGSSAGHGTGTAKEFHMRSNANGKYLCWVNSTGTRYCIKGIDYGSTTEAQGSVWVNGTTNGLRFAHAGRAYRTDQVQIKNSITNTDLKVYSDVGRTSLLATITAGSTSTLGYQATYYLRSQGLGVRAVYADTTISLACAGHLYTVTGTYVAGQDPQYSCDCNYASTTYGSTCSTISESSRCNETGSDGSCNWEGFTCIRNCSFTGDPGSEYMRTNYECEEDLVSGSQNGSFSSGPTITMSA